MFSSAAFGGVLIALMALIKIYIGMQVEDKVWAGLLASLNYSIGFVIIFMEFPGEMREGKVTEGNHLHGIKKK